MGNIEKALRLNRLRNQRSITLYLNAGDPDLDTTYKLIVLCARLGVDVIELGVPFSNSFTDGETVLKSHARALANGVTFEDVTSLIARVREEFNIPIVLLADFSHTVKPRSTRVVVKSAAECGADGILLHGCPPMFQSVLVEQAKEHKLETVFSLYPSTSTDRIAETIQRTSGFVYLVSQYGRNGSPIDFRSPTLQNFYAQVRRATSLPLMAGFGIKNAQDIETIFRHTSLDGVIIGSAISKIIEQSGNDIPNMLRLAEKYIHSLIATRSIGYPDHQQMEDHREYAS